MSDVGMALSRAQDKTEQMQARAAAVNELVDTGAIDDLTAPAGSDLDRQIAALTADTQVDAELAKMKAELGQGAAPAAELEAGDGAEEVRGRTRQGRDGAVIVRILEHGQFRLDDDQIGRLNELDNAVANAAAAGDDVCVPVELRCPDRVRLDHW